LKGERAVRVYVKYTISRYKHIGVSTVLLTRETRVCFAHF